MTNSTVLGIPYLASQQATPEIPHNQALYMIEAMLRGVKAIQNAPPGGPADGDTYIVGTAGSGAWLGKNNCVAIYMSNAWRFIPGFDTLGAQIAMGAAQEGMSLWNIALDARYTWTGAAWSVASGVAASGVSNTPAGNIAATNVQAAINELDTEKVAKAGDTMTGGLIINAAAATAVKAAQTTTGATNTDSALVLESTDAGTSGPTIASYHNSATPAANDVFARWRGYFNNTTPTALQGAAVQFRLIDPTAASEDSQIEFNAFIAGSLLTQLVVGNGTRARGLADPGDLCANFSNYFDDGVNINTIYAGLAGANFTGAVTITRAAFDYNLILEGQDAGVVGPYLQFYHNSASPAVGDFIGGIEFFGKDVGAVKRSYGDVGYRIDATTSGAVSSNFYIAVKRAGVNTFEATFGGGMYLSGATGNGQGVGTSNATAYYANGNLAIDTSALLRPRAFTVGTLPSASGIAGAMARVSDASAAPVYNAVAAGGGSTNAHVMSDGTNWRYC